MWKAERTADAEGPARQPEGARARHRRVPDAGGVSGACRAGRRGAEPGFRAARHADDHARRQGSGVRRRVPARLGGGAVPDQRALDDNGLAGLEEERRLAYVGVTRARRRVAIYFAANRQVRGLWQSSPPSRFIDELPEDHVEVARARRPADLRLQLPLRRRRVLGRSLRNPGLEAGAGAIAVARRPAPGAAARDRGPGGGAGDAETRCTSRASKVFHQKFGPGRVAAVDGAKLTVDFEQVRAARWCWIVS